MLKNVQNPKVYMTPIGFFHTLVKSQFSKYVNYVFYGFVAIICYHSSGVAFNRVMRMDLQGDHIKTLRYNTIKVRH